MNIKLAKIISEILQAIDDSIKKSLELKEFYVKQLHNLLADDIKRELSRLFPEAFRIENKIWMDIESDAIYSWFDVVVPLDKYDWDEGFKRMEKNKILSKILELDYIHIGFKRIRNVNYK